MLFEIISIWFPLTVVGVFLVAVTGWFIGKVMVEIVLAVSGLLAALNRFINRPFSKRRLP